MKNISFVIRSKRKNRDKWKRTKNSTQLDDDDNLIIDGTERYIKETSLFS